MKVLFVLSGGAVLTAVARLLAAGRHARAQLIALAIAGLWYVPVGTVLHLLSIALLARDGFGRGRSAGARG